MTPQTIAWHWPWAYVSVTLVIVVCLLWINIYIYTLINSYSILPACLFSCKGNKLTPPTTTRKSTRKTVVRPYECKWAIFEWFMGVFELHFTVGDNIQMAFVDNLYLIYVSRHSPLRLVDLDLELALRAWAECVFITASADSCIGDEVTVGSLSKMCF